MLIKENRYIMIDSYLLVVYSNINTSHCIHSMHFHCIFVNISFHRHANICHSLSIHCTYIYNRNVHKYVNNEIIANIRQYFQGGSLDMPGIVIPGHVVIITGCNAGIGKETVLDLAKRGARVYMACRNESACEEARLDCIKKSSNSQIYNMQLDLSSMASIRQFVTKYKINLKSFPFIYMCFFLSFLLNILFCI